MVVLGWAERADDSRLLASVAFIEGGVGVVAERAPAAALARIGESGSILLN